MLCERLIYFSHFSSLTHKGVAQKVTPRRCVSHQEKKCLIGTAVDEKLHTGRVEHFGDLMTGKNADKNKPNREDQRVQQER